MPHGTPEARCSAAWHRRASSRSEPSNPSASATATSRAADDESPAPDGEIAGDGPVEAAGRVDLRDHAGHVASPRRADRRRVVTGRARSADPSWPRECRRIRSPTAPARDRGPHRDRHGQAPARPCSRCGRRSGSPGRGRRHARGQGPPCPERNRRAGCSSACRAAFRGCTGAKPTGQASVHGGDHPSRERHRHLRRGARSRRRRAAAAGHGPRRPDDQLGRGVLRRARRPRATASCASTTATSVGPPTSTPTVDVDGG